MKSKADHAVEGVGAVLVVDNHFEYKVQAA